MKRPDRSAPLACALTALLALGAAVPALAAESLPRYGVAVFTNRCISEKSDDLYGARVTLRRIGRADDAVLERADYPPVVVVPVAWDGVRRGRLAFTIPAGTEPAAEVTGQVSPDGRTLTLKGLYGDPMRAEVLQRVVDWRRDTPRCGPR